MKKSEAIRRAIDTMLVPKSPEKWDADSDAISIGYALLKVDETTFQVFCDEGFYAQEIEQLGTPSEETQAIRFMFAEFIALMWEDEEANAQAEVS